MNRISRYGYPRVTELPNGNTEIACRCGWKRTVPAGGIQYTQSQRMAERHAQDHEEPDYHDPYTMAR